jgi:hypothetical protein
LAVTDPEIIPGPLQLYEPPPVPNNPTVTVEQVKVPEFVALAVGGVVFCETIVVAVFEQPVIVLVTSKV